MTKYKDFAEWLFFGALGFVAFSISNNIEKMQTGIQDLNQKVAVIITETNISKDTISDHEVRIRNLESKLKHK